ncbi:hypothetical protein KY289_009205 [Solanum tuberosum]|uniref:Uncharacterized protein n=1 Tax=Solanum tuberosum TaxID=4113 RepID=M1CDQ4_SOLTU|nr:hypothetical protein KY289_009205 [Solanum tuberosum]KAH0715771.1 hypothetical protein KY284_008676 [Solanum tuberosum]
MAAAKLPNSEQKQKNRGVIPKRGQIKAQIFESLVETVTSLFSPKILLGETSGGSGGGDESDGNSTITTSVGSISPPPPPPPTA